MQRRVVVGASVGMALALAGCGGPGGSAVADGWDGTKACDTLTAADVKAVTGQTPEPGVLDGVNDGSNGGAKTSLCTYALADGRAVTFLTRVSEGEDLARAVDSVKNPPADMAMGKQDDVAGVGKAALWNEATHQLQFWLDGDHYGIVGIHVADLVKKPDLSTARDQSIALARRVGG